MHTPNSHAYLSASLGVQEDLYTWNFEHFHNYTSLPRWFRWFAFKYSNNQIFLNDRLSHFIPNQNSECSSCVNANILPACKETLTHLLVYCPGTEPYRILLRDIFPNINLEEFNIVFGINQLSKIDNSLVNCALLIVIGYIINNRRRLARIEEQSFLSDLRKLLWDCLGNKPLYTRRLIPLISDDPRFDQLRAT